MLRTTLTLVIRQMRREPIYSALSVMGLALGVAVFVLITLFVRSERSFDRFHPDADRLYRLNKVVTPRTGGVERHAITSGPMGPALVAEYPEVERTIRVLPWFDAVLASHDDRRSLLPEFVFADSTFFQDFGYRLISGSPETVLSAPMSVVLTRSVATVLFGDQDPVGQTIMALGDLPYVVTGVAEDPTPASHLDFDAIAAWSSVEVGRGGLEYGWLDNWYPQALFTYVRLTASASAGQLEQKLPAFMERHLPDRVDQYRLYLQSVGDLHLDSADLLYTGRTRVGSRSTVNILFWAAVLILVIAGINFVNMSTARATRRAHEVGVRKAVGADQRGLVLQFMSEHFVTTGLAVAAGGFIVASVLPTFSDISGSSVFAGAPLRSTTLLLLAGVWVVTALISGAYPALYLARLSSMSTLRGSGSDSSFGRTTRRVLVVGQFAVSIVLVAGSLLVYRQTGFLLEKSPGFDREQLVVLPIGDTDIREHAAAFRQAVESIPGVVSTTGMNAVPGQTMMSFGINPEGKTQDQTWTSATIRLDDFSLVRTYGLEMASGRFFDETRPTDATAGVVVNEALVRSLGWTNTEAIGRRLDVPGEIEPASVIGVVRDFNFESLRRPVEPLLFLYAPRHDQLTVRLSGNDVPGVIARIRTEWERFDPEYPFQITFLDESFASFYESDRILGRVLGLFALLSLVVAAIGLVALSAFTTERRTREIGIRRVLGASTGSVIALLTRESALLVTLAAVLGAPVAMALGDRWLSGFAYRVEGTALLVVCVAVAALALSFGIVSLQAWRASRVDPARSLRQE